jgi:hypothetical protein
LYVAEAASAALNSRQCENRPRQPAVGCQFTLMSRTTAELVYEQRGYNHATPSPERISANAMRCSGSS